jgi:crossover junction endodeoxyribonuclease RuvC
MIILGIDPGTLVTGYGVIETRNGKTEILAFGAIKNDSGRPMPLRLKRIYDKLNEVLAVHRPDECAIETAFYGKNAQSALKLGQARGVAMLAAIVHDIPMSEYSPREVKKALVGNGTASKQQVQYMIRSVLGFKKISEKFDVSDALAVAVCHLHRLSKPKSAYPSWKGFITAHPERVSIPKKIR